jgi:hypothetical protein
MLWYKGWLETRLRLLFILGMTAFSLFVLPDRTTATPHDKAVLFAVVGMSTAIAVLMASSMLAGAGISTQPPFQATKGIHGSSLFTLSLPVSRLRLLAVRAAIGWFESVAVIAVLSCGIWLKSPLLRSMATPVGMLQNAAILIVCTSALYCLSVLLATFLDDQWRTWGTLIAALAFWWLSYKAWLPASIDIVRAIGKNSPIMAHTIPWPAMAFSVILAAAFFFAALKIVQSREY